MLKAVLVWLCSDLCFLRVNIMFNLCFYKVLKLYVMNTIIKGTGLKTLISLNFQVTFQTWLEMRTGSSHNIPWTVVTLQDVPRVRKVRSIAAERNSIVAGNLPFPHYMKPF